MIKRRDFLVFASGAAGLARHPGDALLRREAPQGANRRNIHDVTDHGAVGNGVADDSAAFLATLAAAAGNRGGVVYVPRGTYKLRHTLVVAMNGITIVGEGMEVSILDFASSPAGTDAVEFRGAVANCQVRDLSIRHSRGSGLLFRGRADGYKYNANCEVSNLLIERPVRHGLYLDTVLESQFRNVYVFAPTTGDAFHIRGGSTSLTFLSCQALRAAAADGYYMEGLSYSAFIACACDNAGRHGYHVAGNSNSVQGVSFISCGCEGAARSAWQFDGGGSGAVRGVVLSGCYAATSGDGPWPSFAEANVPGDGAAEDILLLNCMDSEPRAPTAHSIVAHGRRARVLVQGGSFDRPFAAFTGAHIHRPQPTGVAAPAWGQAISLDAQVATYFTITATSDIAASVLPPTNKPVGPWQAVTLTVEIYNRSGGPLSTPVAFEPGAGGFLLAGAFVSPADTKRRTITFVYNPGAERWVEISRSAADM
jgi:hypothetical protein